LTLSAVFCGVLILGTAALIIAGASDQRTTAFSVDVAPSGVAGRLAPGHTLCQAPVPVTSKVGAITVWASPEAPAASSGLAATVRDARSGALLARSRLLPSSPSASTPATLRGALTRPLQPSVPVSICLTSSSARALNLLGSAARSSSGALTVDGRRTNRAAAMVFATPHPQSLIAMLPTVFSRAALFHPRWIGAWTFWALMAGLVLAAGLVLRALLAAVTVDDRDSAAGERVSRP
jgi:hypothetical protein